MDLATIKAEVFPVIVKFVGVFLATMFAMLNAVGADALSSGEYWTSGAFLALLSTALITALKLSVQNRVPATLGGKK